MWQTISIVGALTILAPFVANQLGWISSSRVLYAGANFLGAAILTVVAIIDEQVGFIVVQGAWALVSLVGIVTIVRPRGDGSHPTRFR